MPSIELKVSDKVHQEWQAFLKSMQASRLLESGLLGDWTLAGFMQNVDEYLHRGGPVRHETDEEKRDRENAEARRKLTKPQKRVLPMFNENDKVTCNEIARVLGVTPDDARNLVDSWLYQDFLAPAGDRDGQPSYTLSTSWQERNLGANRPSLNAPRNVFQPAQGYEFRPAGNMDKDS